MNNLHVTVDILIDCVLDSKTLMLLHLCKSGPHISMLIKLNTEHAQLQTATALREINT